LERPQTAGSWRGALLGAADPQRPIAYQQAAFVRNLRFAAGIAARDGLVLCLETLSRRSVPDMLLQHMPDAVAVANAVDHPAVRLIFDTSHV